MKVEQKQLAIELRKQGKSYNEISKITGVAKSTLNHWLKDVVLTEEQRSLLSSRSSVQGCRGGAKHRQMWIDKRKEIMDAYDPPFCDPVFMLGLGLYWGEGTKHSPCTTAFANSDVGPVKQFIVWVRRFFEPDFDNIGVCIHHYNSEADEAIKGYWSTMLGIPLADFNKSVFTVSRASKRKKSNTLPYGTAHVFLRGKGNWVVRTKIEKALTTALSYNGIVH